MPNNPGFPQPGFPQHGFPQPGGYPQPGGMMPPPTRPSGCPQGLEYLTQLDLLLVHQQVEMTEALTGFETANKYIITNALGQTIYFAIEESGCFVRNFCGSTRPFAMKIIDQNQLEVIHLDRPLRCQTCCYPCCLQKMEVLSGNSPLGTIKQNWSLCKASFDIKNEGGDTVLKIQGPFCIGMIGNVNFDILSADGHEKVGKITKKCGDIAQEMFTDADTFGISFPMDLDVRTKATMLGAVFLIDFMFFEPAGKNTRPHVF